MSVKSLLLWGLTMTALFGAAGLIAPGLLVRLNTLMGRWYSTRRALKPVEQPHTIEPLLYRHHQRVGAFVVVVASFNVLMLLFLPLTELDSSVEGIVATTLKRVVLLGNSVAIPLGLLIYFRPSTLRRLEEPANRWISLRPAAALLEQSHAPLDNAFSRHPRAFSLFILLGSLYAVTMTFIFL